MKNKKLIGFIELIRREKNVKIEHLCEGLCTQGFYSKILSGEKNPGELLVNLILGRLGIAKDYYESYMSYADYIGYKMRCDIIVAIENENVNDAIINTQKYKKEIGKTSCLHERFILQAEAGIMTIEGASDDKICEKLKRAVLITIPRFEKTELGKLILSPEELFLTAEYASFEEKVKGHGTSQKIYEQIIDYMDSTEFDNIAKSKIYPKVVCLLSAKYLKNKEYKKNINKTQIQDNK